MSDRAHRCKVFLIGLNHSRSPGVSLPSVSLKKFGWQVCPYMMMAGALET